MCVSIFAFISGYALSSWSIQKKRTLIEAYRKSLGQLVRLYQRYWLVFLTFVPVGIAFYNWKLSFVLLKNGLLYGEAYCGEWWYVKQYGRLMLLFPILNLLLQLFSTEGFRSIRKYFTKSNLVKLSFLGGVFTVYVVILRLYFWDSIAGRLFVWCVNTASSIVYFRLTDYDKIFIVAYLISRYHVFEYISQVVNHFAISMLGIVGIVAIRYFYVTNPAQSDCDVYLIPFLIYFLVCTLHTFKNRSFVMRALKCLGKNSTFMWLIHPIFLYHYLQKLVLWPRYSLFIYLWTVLVSLVTADIFAHVNDLILKIIKNVCKLRE